MNYAIILSGGVGSRTGLDIPKQYYEVGGKTIVEYVIETINKCAFLDAYIIVASTKWHKLLCQIIKKYESGKNPRFLGFAEPGNNRQLSIYSGLLILSKVAKADDRVLIQDAARPNTTVNLYKNCMLFSDDYDGAMPVLPMKDTVYRSKDGEKIEALLNRSEIYAGQAPEAFLYGKYFSANKALLPDEILMINGSSEPAILNGMRIKMICGEEKNIKITTPDDISAFKESLVED